jgi:Domain of unknown function (DUF4266)
MRHPRTAALLLLALSGCTGPRFHERQRLADRACGFDQDRAVLYLRNKVEAAREGSFGGFGGASAGGCGCQ